MNSLWVLEDVVHSSNISQVNPQSTGSKYGLCVIVLVHCLKAQVYTGKPPGGTREKNQGMRVVMDLTQELRGQNVTCDNFDVEYIYGFVMLGGL